MYMCDYVCNGRIHFVVEVCAFCDGWNSLVVSSGVLCCLVYVTHVCVCVTWRASETLSVGCLSERKISQWDVHRA